MRLCCFPQGFQELRFARAVAPDDRVAVSVPHRDVVSLSGAHPAPDARIDDFQPGAGIGTASPLPALTTPPPVVGVSHPSVLAAEEHEHRLWPDILPFLDPVRLRHRRVLADPGQFRRDGRRPNPARPAAQPRTSSASPAGSPVSATPVSPCLRIQEERGGEGKQRQPRARIVRARRSAACRPRPPPRQYTAPRCRPRKRHAPNVVGPRAAGLDDPADKRDQLVALRPVVAQGPDVALVIAEPAKECGVFRGQELALRGRRPLAILAEVPADLAILLQIGAVGIDAHLARRVAMDDVEQVVPAGLGRTRRASVRSCRG